MFSCRLCKMKSVINLHERSRKLFDKEIDDPATESLPKAKFDQKQRAESTSFMTTRNRANFQGSLINILSDFNQVYIEWSKRFHPPNTSAFRSNP